MTDITRESIVVAGKDQVSSDLAGETVLLSMTSAHYYGFEGVGARIWELIAEPMRVSAVCETIANEYDVAPERCQADVLAFLGSLDDVKRVVKVVVFVASTPDFTGQPKVANGASELLGEVFGDAGSHARSAVGVSVLPLDVPVEVEIVVEV